MDLDLQERLLVWQIYVKKLFTYGTIYFAIPAFMARASTVLGLSSQIITAGQLVEFINKYGELAIIIIAVLAGANTAYVVRQDEIKRAAKNFYAVNSNARIERASRVFYKLYKDGLLIWDSSVVRQEKWDMEVKKALEQYCTEDARRTYDLSNTDPSHAIDWIKTQLNNEFFNGRFLRR